MGKLAIKSLQRFFALLLCVAMVLPFVPAQVFALDGEEKVATVAAVDADPVYVLAGSDFQMTTADANDWVTPAQNVKNILSKIPQKSFDGFLFCGDYSVGNAEDMVAYTYDGYNALTAAIREADVTYSHEYCIQGNHEPDTCFKANPSDAATAEKFLTDTSYYETDHYGVYCLNWKDYSSDASKEAVIAQAENIEKILNDKTVGEKPIFVISHTPLHHSSRSVRDKDTQYAEYLVDTLNALGQKGLNIIFLYGHNHSSGYDFYMGGTTNFAAKGDTLYVTDPSDVSAEAIPHAINFTYMNAGYVGQIIHDGRVDATNTMSVFEIVGDDVTIRRYSADGEYALQAKPGVKWDQNDDGRGYEPDTKTQASGLSIEGNSLELNVPELVSNCNFAIGNTAQISLKNPVAGVTYEWAVASVAGENAVVVTAVSDNMVHLEADTSGASMLTVKGSDGSEASICIQVVGEAEEPVVETTNQYFFRLVDHFTEGKNYMLIDRNSSGTAHYASTSGSGSTVTNGEIKVGSYRDSMPFVMYTYGSTVDEISRPVWVYQDGRLKNYTRSSVLSTANTTGGQGTPVVLQGAGISVDTWTLKEGLWANGAYVLFQNVNGSKEYVWQSGIDARYHTKVYAYEETPLYAVGQVTDKIGRVAVGAGADALTGSYITKTWSNGRVEYVPITVGMLGGVDTSAAGIKRNLIVTYNGKELCTDYTLNVGVDRTVTVDAYTYYTLTNTLTAGETYLVVNRNSKGAGYLMESSTNNSGVTAQRIVVSLDDDGLPCVREGDIAFVPNVNPADPFTRQEWKLRTDGRFYQPNAFSTSGSTYLKKTPDYLTGPLLAGDSDATFNFVSPYVTGPDSTRPGYITLGGKVNGVNFFVEFKALEYIVDANNVGTSYPDTFWVVRDFDRCLGQEVSVYQKVTSTNAQCSALSLHGTVNVNSGSTSATGTKLCLTRDDGQVIYLDVTLGMLSGSYYISNPGTYPGLTLTYGGKIVATDYTLTVVDPDNPRYPDPGTVAVDKVKNTTEYDFDETGVARIDLSVKGTPIAVPLDVLVILDTSSSMNFTIPGTNETRLEALHQALENMITDLAQPNADGSLPDIQVAITQFNNYNYFSNVNALVGDTAPVDTGFPESSNGTIQSWTSVFEMQNFNTSSIRTYAGTNYDVAFQHAYELLSERKQSAPGRDQVVIFMTDGICLQYNFLANQLNPSDDAMWAKWLLGEMTPEEVNANVPELARNWYRDDGKNWLAEAIKGQGQLPIINKRVFADHTLRHKIGGDYEPSMFQNVEGLGAKMYTIGFSLSGDGSATAEISRRILKKIATSESMFYSAEQTEELHAAFRDIGLSVRTASSQAALYDTMGQKFDLQMGAVKTSDRKTVAKRPTITLKAYDLYRITEVGTYVNGKLVTEAMVGTRKGSVSVLETVTFNDAGTEAYSSLKTGNILTATGIIHAQYFEYNTNKDKDDPLATPMVPTYETFRWNIGSINEQELVLSYYVKLENALGEDGKGVAAGTYETNASAYLQYVDAKGNAETVNLESPRLNWTKAGFNYGFYLVDEQGNPIRDNNGGFITVGNSVYSEINLNVDVSTGTPTAPSGYVLYDPNASYGIHVSSGVAEDESAIAGKDPNSLTWNNGGGWSIGGTTGTTWVYYENNTKQMNTDRISAIGDFNNTTAWFAVVKTDDPEQVLDKKVAATTDANKFDLTLEAFSEGQLTEITVTKPADIVLVLDRSASMYTPVGASAVQKKGMAYSDPDSIIPKDQLDPEKAKKMGYYVAHGNTYNNWFYIWYDENAPETGRWKYYSVLDTESFVNPQYPSVTEEEAATSATTQHTKVQFCAKATQIPAHLDVYKSQYAVLYDAVLEYVQDLKASGAEHRVAIVGFAGAEDQRTQVYVSDSANVKDNGMVKAYNTLYGSSNAARRNELYQIAMKNVQDSVDYSELLEAIEAFSTNYSFTCPAAGIHLGKDVLAANSLTARTPRDRIMILFTDGIPNSMTKFKPDGTLYTNDLAADTKDGDGLKTTEHTARMYNQIVGMAHAVKALDAKIYSVSTSTLGNADRSFLDIASSNYPNATSFDSPGTSVAESERKYAITVENFDELHDAFQTVTSSSSSTQVQLDSTSVLKEFVSKYFDLDETDGRRIEVYALPYDGSGSFSDPANFAACDENTLVYPVTGSGISVTLKESVTGSGRKDIIEVTGFDYQTEYLSTWNRSTVAGQTFYGRKLVVKVPVETREGFWGGNNVPTNNTATGIYTGDVDNTPGSPVTFFPVPEVNVPINVDITTKDKTIYYDGQIKEGEKTEGETLLEGITAGYGDTKKPVGVEVVTSQVPNEDGTGTVTVTTTVFTPQESWMDDFANIGWTGGDDPLTKDLSNTNSGKYPYSVTVTPKYDGTENRSENGSNIAGNVDGGEIRNEDLTQGSVTDSSNANVYVLVPELTFKDSYTSNGTPVAGYDFDAKDYVSTSTKWVEQTTGKTPDGNEIPLPDATAPTLELTYQVQGGGSTFQGDTAVDVTVTADGTDITDQAWFKWQQCNHSVGVITTHRGNGEVNEFWVHTSSVVPDVVVIDFGLDVVVDVLANDQAMNGIDPTMTGIGAYTNPAFGTAGVKGSFGTLTIENQAAGKVRYRLDRDGMDMKTAEIFRYEVQYVDSGNVLVSDNTTLTVIPASIIYYEDDFVTTVKKIRDNTTTREWRDDGAWEPVHNYGNAAVPGEPVQGEHRPGETEFDTVYGHDTAYQNFSMYSLGKARKVTVDALTHGVAQFTFWGTGFDVISLSSSDTGFVTVQVQQIKDAQGNPVTSGTVINKAVDTYYGYVYEMNALTGQMEWKPSNNSDAIYQVPVIKVEKLPYGQYQVTITASYSEYFDHKPESGTVEDDNAAYTSYDFYLDAIRIYDPAKGDSTSEGAYTQDGEMNATYQELRNLLITKGLFNALEDATVSGAVFVDGISQVKDGDQGTHDGPNHEDVSEKIATKPAAIQDYANYGPNNEVYLAKGQGVAFNLEPGSYNRVYLSLKAPMSGTAGKVTVYGIDPVSKAQTPVTLLTDQEIKTATDLYFEITDLIGKTVVIVNNGDGLISVTNLRFASDGTAAAAIDDAVTINREAGHSVLELLNGFSQDEVETDVMGGGTAPVDPVIPGTQPTEPEVTEPEATEPEATEPETTEPEITEPETSEPEITEPETTEPEATEPEVIEPDAFNPEKVEVELSNTSVKVGSQVMVTVTTGEDVAYLTVNGAKVTFFTEENGQRIWRVRLTAKEVGGMAIRVIGYSETGAASQTMLKILEVTDSYTSIGNWLEDLIIRIVSSLTK